MKIVRACAFCACGLVWPGPAGPAEEKPVRLYTNADLERMAPFRDETGVNCVPSEPAAMSTSSSEDRARAKRDEAYWRREAERHRRRLQQWRERIAEAQSRIADRSRRPRLVASWDTQIQRWERQIRRLEEQVREAEMSFDERARRAGALPGWLR